MPNSVTDDWAEAAPAAASAASAIKVFFMQVVPGMGNSGVRRKKSRPKAAFQVSCFLRQPRGCLETLEAVADAQVHTGAAAVERAREDTGLRQGGLDRQRGAVLVADVRVGRVQGGALGQVVHVTQGPLAGFRLVRSRVVQLGAAVRQTHFAG